MLELRSEHDRRIRHRIGAARDAALDLAGLGRELVKPLVDTTEVVASEGVVASADLADIGVILGTGFAPFLGGPMQARKEGKA